MQLMGKGKRMGRASALIGIVAAVWSTTGAAWGADEARPPPSAESEGAAPRDEPPSSVAADEARHITLRLGIGPAFNWVERCTAAERLLERNPTAAFGAGCSDSGYSMDLGIGAQFQLHEQWSLGPWIAVGLSSDNSHTEVGSLENDPGSPRVMAATSHRGMLGVETQFRPFRGGLHAAPRASLVVERETVETTGGDSSNTSTTYNTFGTAFGVGLGYDAWLSRMFHFGGSHVAGSWT